ncbi:MAG: DUF3187 family protein [Gammaproteobacteria bacterium]
MTTRDGRVASIVPIVALFVTLAAATTAAAQEPVATGFVMQNRSPFAAIIGVPGRWPDNSANIAELSWNASSHAKAETSAGFASIVDGETHSLTARFQFPVLQRFRVGLQLPWISHSGGFLDSTIDTWHEIFGLNEGIRPQVPRNELNYVLDRQGAEVYRLSDSTSGIGDVQVGLTADLGSFDRNAKPGTVGGYLLRMPWRLSLNVKLPTGDIDKLTGSGETDVSLGVGWRSPDDTDGRLRWWLDAGVTLPGDVDIAALQTESQVYYYDGALTWRLTNRFDLIAQLAGHSRLYAGDVADLGRTAAQLAIGGLWHMSPRFGLRFGFYEDVIAESAPDFGFELSLLIRRW